MTAEAAPARFGVWGLVKRFRWRVVGTLALVVLESVGFLLFPLLMGITIDGLLEDDYRGLFVFFAALVVTLAIAAGRRFFDTRAYTSVYRTVASEMVENERRKGTPVSKIAARSTLLVEFIEFLENSLPMILGSFISITGTLVILFGMDARVGVASLGLIGLIGGVYVATLRLNTRFNTGYNDELESQVDAISSNSMPETMAHFRRLMRWNVKLSDLETINYSIIFVGVVALMIFSPVALVSEGARYGLVFSGIMYVLQYIEDLLSAPLHLQQLIRLREIGTRLSTAPDELQEAPGA